MRKEWLKIGVFFLIIAAAVFFSLNYLFLSGKTAQKSKATGETIELIYDPTSATAAANADFSVTLKVKPSVDVTLRGYKVILVFDESKINLKQIEYKLGTASADLADTDNELTTVNASGSAKLIGEIQNSTGQLLSAANTTDLVKLTFTALSSTGTSFVITNNDAQFYIVDGNGWLRPITLSSTAQFDVNGGAAITPTIPVDGNTKLYLKLKFQGITTKPADERNSMNVKFTLSGGNLATPSSSLGTFTSDAEGVWTGGVGFNLTSPAGKKYILYAKGPRHVQKKICDIKPTETSPGIYSCSDANFTLATGDNNQDLSGVMLLSGDIYGPNKVQDGVVNSIDLSFVKNNLNKTDAATLAVCDINLDGACDTQDYSLIISALSIKTDEL